MRKIALFSAAAKTGLILQWVLGIFACLFGILYNFTPFQDMVKTKLFAKTVTDEQVLIADLSLITTVLLSVIYRTGEKSDRLYESIEDSKVDFDDKLFFKGTLKIYQDVDVEMKSRRVFGKVVEIDILGYTLFSVSAKFADWKVKGQLYNTVFNLYHLDSDFVANSPFISSSWKSKLESNLCEINQFIAQNKDFMKKNKVEINLFPYKHIPSVHGFKMGNGSIYMSIAYWNEELMIGDPAYQSVYIKIGNADSSRFAKEVRRVFDNWINKAKSYI